ncbi:hypothetical protein F5X97DRAFT_235776 [Nemania serpens]|nr:hypothetical protein F5X97DRAFT_235776 [Nemania serpens]
MRRHVAISGLLAYLIGLSVGDRAEDVSLGQHDEGTAIGSTPVVSISYKNSHTFEIALSSSSTFSFDTTSDVELGTVRLKIYSENGLDDGQDIIASTTLPSATAPTDADGLSAGSSQGIAPNNDLFKPGSSPNTLTIVWSRNSAASAPFSFDYLDKPLYLESQWKTTLISGSSTSPLFAVYDKNYNEAKSNLETARKGNSSNSPARPDSTTTLSSSPTPASPSGTSKPPTQATTATGQPAATIGPSASPSALPAPNGLSRGAIIGIAVGVGVGGLLVAGVLSWLFCFRRRRRSSRNAAHHTMPSYDSDVGAHASMTDKETPVLLEAASRQSTYGGGEGRPSVDPYAPYSDRSAASPTPHYRGTDAPAAPAAPTTSQTDLTWTNGAPAPTPVIASRYAHLVEEGMTTEEIRRLEDEERQLDMAIENAGRRRDT